LTVSREYSKGLRARVMERKKRPEDRGLGDWVDAAEIAYVVQLELRENDPNEVRETALKVIAKLIESKLMKAATSPTTVFKHGA
jgi:hypothetical protein